MALDLDLKKKEPAKPRLYPECDKAWLKSVLNKILFEGLFEDNPLTEKMQVRTKPKFNTACWTFRKPTHFLFVGEDLFQKDNLPKGLSEELLVRYVKNHFKHEEGHGKFTDRDLPKVNKVLQSFKCPFSLFNLFEDAHMEDKVRKDGYSFEWLLIESMEFSNRPESLFFGLIQAEGNAKLVQARLTAYPVGEKLSQEQKDLLTSQFDEVHDFYLRVLAVKESLDLVPILKEWIERFGLPPSQGSGSFASNGELQTGAELANDDELFEEFSEETEEVAGTSAEKPGNGKLKGTPDEALSALVSKKGNLLDHLSDGPVDQELAQVIATKFTKFFEQKARTINTDAPGKRISVRNYVLGKPAYKRVEIKGRERKKIFVTFDCSGSMGGEHVNAGRTLLKALSLLARKGVVSGHVALSAVVDGIASWELFKLPMSDSDIASVKAFAGAEGLEYTISDNIAIARDADYTFVYTDGQICDRAIDKAKFHKQGVFTWGLYVGSNEKYLDEMFKYFDKAILRKTLVELVDAMLAQNK